jgi:hypothetical protein
MQELAREEGPDASRIVRTYAALDKVLSRSAQRRALKLECAKKHAEDPAEFRTCAFHQIFDFRHWGTLSRARTRFV